MPNIYDSSSYFIFSLFGFEFDFFFQCFVFSFLLAFLFFLLHLFLGVIVFPFRTFVSFHGEGLQFFSFEVFGFGIFF